MKKSRFTAEQIIGFIRQAEAGMPVKELCRKGGFSDATFYKWRVKYGGMDVTGVNHKRGLRLYQEANLSVRKRRKAKRPVSERVPLQLARAVNEVWSMDFVSDSLASGRRIKFLAVADDSSHECVQIGADFGIPGEYVTRLLDETARFRGYPRAAMTTALSSPAGPS